LFAFRYKNFIEERKKLGDTDEAKMLDDYWVNKRDAADAGEKFLREYAWPFYPLLILPCASNPNGL